MTIKKTFLRIVFFCNIACVVALLAGDLSPYLNPAVWWPVALLGLAFPMLVLLDLCFFLFWIFAKPRHAIYSLVAALLSIPGILVTFGGHISSSFEEKKTPGDLRVMTWNVGLMNYSAPDSNTAIRNNGIIFKKIKESQADVICLQEFFTCVIPGHYLNFADSVSRTMGYPYQYFARDIPKFNGNFYMGTIIFSRYPIADSERIVYSDFPGSVIRTGLVVGPDTVDIVTTRLQSNYFHHNEYQTLRQIKNGQDSALSGSKNIIKKLRLGYRLRVAQVGLVRELIDRSNRPLIFTGDLNDVPVSYTYHTIRSGMQDVWAEKGAGIGRTFDFISPTLRIDQIFCNRFFTPRQIKRVFSEYASDHNALVADLTMEK